MKSFATLIAGGLLLTGTLLGADPLKNPALMPVKIEKPAQHEPLTLVKNGKLNFVIVCETEDEARGYFAKVRRLFEDAKPRFGKPDFDTLPMGMSSDYAAAILEGSTLVRVGSALFGQRRY